MRRLLLMKWVLGAALLSGLALSPRLWITDRAFPTVPALPGLPDLPNSLCLALTFGMVLCTLLTLVLPRPRFLLTATPILGAVLVLFDINRLQPWFYQYLLMFFALGLVRWDQSEDGTASSALAICGVILGLLYIWSGVQKANSSFATSVFPWLLEPLSDLTGDGIASMPFIAPVLEALIGIFLIVPSTRTIGVMGAAGMHLLLLYLLGPFGHDYNSVIWPWNVAMLAMAFVLFFRNDEPVLGHAWRPAIGKAVVVLVGVMPFLCFFEKWDHYLSASLYSGRTRDAWIMLAEPATKRLIESLSKAENARLKTAFDGYSLDITSWSRAELNVPLYPEQRVFEGVAKKLRKFAPSPEDVTLLVTERPVLFREPEADSEEFSFR